MEGNVCSQCGYIHPPLAQGQICPMAGAKTSNNNSEEIEGLTDFFSTMKIIIKSNDNIIKNKKSFFNNVIILTQKYIDVMKEKG